MAFPVSDKGYFQITALSFSPSIIAMGESTTVTVTLKNVSGKTVGSCYINMYGKYPAASAAQGMGSTASVYLHGGPSFAMTAINWSNNATKTFTGTVNFSGSYPVDTDNYVLDLSKTRVFVQIVTNVTFASGGNYDNFTSLCGSSGEYLTVLQKRDNPRLNLEINRTPNDEAVAVATSVSLAADSDLTTLSAHGYTFTLYRTSAHNPATVSDTVTTLNCTLSQMYTGIVNSTSAITTTFSNGSDWYFLLRLTNGKETAYAHASIPRAFANVHMSGCTTGGVAFGKFSSATEGGPKFECEYPAYFSSGVFDGTGHEIGGVQTAGGTITRSAGYGSGMVSTATFSFGKTFSSVPIVMCEFARLSTNSDGSGTSSSLGSVALSVSAVTTTQFTVTVWNNSGRRFYGDLVWLASETSASTTAWS